MLPTKLAFIDVETTGGRSHYDRIIEIGIVRIEDNKLVKTFTSLLNPNAYLPREVTMLTGITAGDLENAPTFREVRDEIAELLEDCIFVAHNVRFDYSFVKTEFARQNHTFTAKQLCTVKLARLLYPTWSHHNLDSVIECCGFSCKNRHRAFDDAEILWQFYQYLQATTDAKVLESAINTCLKKPSRPIKLSQEILDKLPEKPGVYIFYGAQERSDEAACEPPVGGETGVDTVASIQGRFRNEFGMTKELPLYVGKSRNIRERVLSHFAADIRSGVEMQIAQQIEHIETITTAGELGALLLESQLIKKLLPLYNRKSRLKRELVAIKNRLTKGGYQEVYLERVSKGKNEEALDILQSSLCFFKSRRQAKTKLAELAKKYHLCEKLLGLEKTTGACFAYRLEQCKGACIGKEKPEIYNLRFLMAFATMKIASWPFDGVIMIEEGDPEGKKEYFLINQWSYIGKVGVDEQGNQKEELLPEVIFDLDTYQIIRQFIRQPENQKKIKLLSRSKSLEDNFKSLPHDIPINSVV